jgi:heterodisulfide reductase subunit A-like polyferredoxin
LNEDGLYNQAHVKLRPEDLAIDGIFLCALALGPKTFDETIHPVPGQERKLPLPRYK